MCPIFIEEVISGRESGRAQVHTVNLKCNDPAIIAPRALDLLCGEEFTIFV
jgi:hypothetical protein